VWTPGFRQADADDEENADETGAYAQLKTGGIGGIEEEKQHGQGSAAHAEGNNGPDKAAGEQRYDGSTEDGQGE